MQTKYALIALLILLAGGLAVYYYMYGSGGLSYACTGCSTSSANKQLYTTDDVFLTTAELAPTTGITAGGQTDVSQAQWARQIATRPQLPPADQRAKLGQPPKSLAFLTASEDFPTRAQQAAADEKQATPIGLDFSQLVGAETNITRLLPTYTSKSVDAFIQPYYRIQSNLGSMDETYYKKQMASY